jgi:hypothetical protein
VIHPGGVTEGSRWFAAPRHTTGKGTRKPKAHPGGVQDEAREVNGEQ